MSSWRKISFSTASFINWALIYLKLNKIHCLEFQLNLLRELVWNIVKPFKNIEFWVLIHQWILFNHSICIHLKRDHKYSNHYQDFVSHRIRDPSQKLVYDWNLKCQLEFKTFNLLSYLSWIILQNSSKKTLGKKKSGNPITTWLTIINPRINKIKSLNKIYNPRS